MNPPNSTTTAAVVVGLGGDASIRPVAADSERCKVSAPDGVRSVEGRRRKRRPGSRSKWNSVWPHQNWPGSNHMMAEDYWSVKTHASVGFVPQEAD